jgi:hypothetical protein
LKERHCSTGPEQEKAAPTGRKQGESSTHSDSFKIGQQSGDIETDTTPDDDLNKAEVLTQLSQKRSIAPHPGVGTVAVVAFFFVDADQLVAGGADDRSTGLTFEYH